VISGKIYDMHVHLHEFSDEEIEEFEKQDIVLVAVSEDLETLLRTLEIAKTFTNVIPCAGYHPWNFRDNGSVQEAIETARVAYHNDIMCIGEVGLDNKFVPSETWHDQIRVLKVFLSLASELDAYVTLHTPYAWKQVLTMLVDMNVRKAMFHWYTGPVELIDTIISYGYYISINPAIKIQRKHIRVAENAPLQNIVLESDGPYNYRGLRLTPTMIYDTIKILSNIKNIDENSLIQNISINSQRLLFG